MTAQPVQHAFSFTTVQGGSLRSLFELLAVIIHDVSLVVSPEGIKVLTADGVRNSLIWLRLNPEGFEHYECSGTHRVGINISAVYKLLKTAASHDTISMFMAKDSTDVLGIRISNPEKRVSTEFTMRLLDVNFEQITVPDVQFDAIVSLPSAFFQRLCRDASHLAEKLVLTAQGDTMEFAVNNDAASQKTIISPVVEGKHVVTITWTEEGDTGPVSGTFELKYLTCFCRATSLSPQLQMFLRRDYPLVMRFAVSNLGELRFALANLASSSSPAS